MDTVWVAYIRDRRHSLWQIALDKEKYAEYENVQDSEIIVGIFESQEMAEKAVEIVLRQMGWRGRSYHPNVWMAPDRYEYGWRAVPFNQFNVPDLFSVCHLQKWGDI